MGRFVRGKDLKASTVKSPSTFGDTQGGAILADSITSIGDITVIAGNITADVITGNSFVGVTASPAGSPNEVQYNNAGSLGASANFTYDGTYGLTVQEDITSIGNVNGNNVVSTNDVTTYTVTATGNITGDNLLTGGLVSATGNVTGGNVIVSNLTSGRIVIATTSGHLTDDSNFTWDGTTFTTGNISAGAISVSSIDSAFGNITTTGNIQGGNLISDGIVSVIGNINGANLIATEAVSAGSTIDAVGNVTGGNVVADTAVIATLGNVEGVNLVTTGVVDATGNITGGNLIATGNVDATVNGYDIGYRTIPQVSSGDVTLALTDSGKHYYSTTSATETITIPLNSSVAFEKGAAIMIVNKGTGSVTVARTSGVDLYLAGNSTSANRTVTTYGMATLIKTDDDEWFISGTGVE